MFLYSIFDKKAKQFDSHVMCFSLDDVAERSVIASLNERSLLVLYPSDYRLVRIGSFNSTSGELSFDDVYSKELIDLIPDKFKRFAIDGSFTN